MKKVLLMAAVIFLAFGTAHAQSKSSEGYAYTNALGLRIGIPLGFSYKHFINPQGALEGGLGIGPEILDLTALYEYHGRLGSDPGFRWYGGGGFDYWFGGSYSELSLSPVIGLDYKIKSVPIDLSLDWKPDIFLVGNVKLTDFNTFFPYSGGIGLRYAF